MNRPMPGEKPCAAERRSEAHSPMPARENAATRVPCPSRGTSSARCDPQRRGGPRRSDEHPETQMTDLEHAPDLPRSAAIGGIG